MPIPNWTSDQAATIQAIASLVGIVTAIIGIVIAILVPNWQQSGIQEKAAHDKADEVRAIRLALHTEVSMTALQCLREFHDWCDAPPPPGFKNVRTAKFPLLTIYEGNASKIGLLSREEI